MVQEVTVDSRYIHSLYNIQKHDFQAVENFFCNLHSAGFVYNLRNWLTRSICHSPGISWLCFVVYRNSLWC